MEEKERYYYKKILRDCVMPEGLFEIKDRESNFSLIIENKKDVNTITNLLNQQDKRIKELEQQLSKDFTLGEYIRLEQENQQLKQTIQTIHQNVRNSSLEDIKYIETLKEEIEDWQEAYQQLKQQLHDLPKQIVEEIRKELKFVLSDFQCIFDTDKLVDTILKKFGGEI